MWVGYQSKQKDHYCERVLNDYPLLFATITGLDFCVWIVLGSAHVSDLRLQQQYCMDLLLFLVAGMIFEVKSVGVIEQPCRSPPQLC